MAKRGPAVFALVAVVAFPGASGCSASVGKETPTVGVTAKVTAVGKPGDPSAVNYDIAADNDVTPAPPR